MEVVVTTLVLVRCTLCSTSRVVSIYSVGCKEPGCIGPVLPIREFIDTYLLTR